MTTSAETASSEMEAARVQVAECEKEIQNVKAGLRQLQATSSADGAEEAPNSLEIAVIKVEGLPESAKPSFTLQLSSPVEEQILMEVFDPSAPTENVATFSAVEASVATLTVSAKDAEIPLGVSTLYEVAPLCPVDALSPKPSYETELAVAIVAEGAEEEFKDSKQEIQESESQESQEGATIVQPICTVTLRIIYKPSTKDLREELYDLLNKASQKKAAAITNLRKSAANVSRSAPPSKTKSKSPAVKAGFLNKKKKEPSKIQAWYQKWLGPQSMLRASIIPISKNYVIFFGTIALCHWKGHELALPAPV